MKMMILYGVVNAVYLLLWILINKRRNSKSTTIRTFDNGYEFYTALSEDKKEKYWSEDTKNLNVFFFLFLMFLEAAVYFIGMNSIWWMFALLIGLLFSTAIEILLSVKLRRKYKNEER